MRAAVFALALALGAAACGGGGDPIPDVVDGRPADAAITPDAGPDASPECTSETGCYLCEPVQLLEFLNHCTDAQCFPFDNVARLPLYNGGDLPPLPTN